MKFNWEDFKNGKIAVRCDTEEKANEFIKQCYKHGMSWRYSCTNDINWKWYTKYTYYKCDSNLCLIYGDINNGLVKPPVVEYKEDNKMELKEGMIVECRNGYRYLLRRVDGELIASSNDAYMSLNYDKELNENKYFDEDCDVMKVYTSKALMLDNLFNNKYLTCIWERRKEPKKMTLAQISEALGYEVEVIDNE